MGSGASADNARATVSTMLSNKPDDASDISDLEQAKNEIRNLRKMAKEFQTNLREEGKDAAKNKKREAVLDRGGDKLQKGIDAKDYVPKVIEKGADIKALLEKVVVANILFSSYSSTEHSAIVDAFAKEEATEGSYVIRQGDSGDNFYVVESGILEIYVKGPDGESKVGSTLGPGSAFGELALMYNTPRAASIKATSKCVLWTIDRNTYRGIVVYYKFLRNKQYIEFLKNVEIMDKKLGVVMTEAELEKMVASLEREQYEPGDAIIRQNNKGDQFYIIADGEVNVVKTTDGKDEKLAVLKQGNYFGEKALLKEDVRQASCIAETKVTCLSLGREDFIDMMGTLEDMMTGNREEEKPVPPPVSAAASVNKDSLDIAIGDLQVMSTLGCGAFGRVKLCRIPAKDQFYALKCQSKRAIIDSGLQEHVLNEMHIMKLIDHPYIAKLHASLQDDTYIYFVLELLLGGELFTHLRHRGKLSEQSTRFYCATVVYAFLTLHSKKIAYRDLKPENLVMDVNGYVKLVDFGLAKQLFSGKTWTLCGTPDYLAPEIILNEGHDMAVDYWALGVLIYEMVSGAPPFYAEDPMEVYEKILGGNHLMPTYFSRNLADLVKKLLRSQQAKRLGNTRGSTAAVIKHKWFSSFDWAGLETGDMKAPYKPKVTAPDDTTNFDRFDEGDTPLPSDWNPDLS